MATFASLPLFTDSWVADTKHLSRLERGTYHDLLVLMWRTPSCRVPNDDVWLGRHLGMNAQEVANELRPIISEFCKSDGNWITQKRLTKEYEYVTKAHERASVSAKARWRKEKEIQRRNAPTPTPTPTIEEAKASSREALKRATRLAENWTPSVQDWDYARSKGLPVDRISTEAEKFRNYWTAKSGQEATKLNWSKTWQNWILTTVERTGVSNGRQERRTGTLTDRALALAQQAYERRIDNGGQPTSDAGRSVGDGGAPSGLLSQWRR